MRLDDVAVSADAQFRPVEMQIDGSRIVGLETEVEIVADAPSWQGVLYRPLATATRRATVRIVPYFAWGNRGRCDMTVWLPLAR